MTQIVIILQMDDVFQIFSDTNLNRQENLNKKENPTLKSTFKEKILKIVL